MSPSSDRPSPDTLRRLGLGRLAYLAWHAPLAAAAKSWREGGPWQQWITRRAGRRMEKAAWSLPPAPAAEPGTPEVGWLTGGRFWHQTAFCAWSFRAASGLSPRWVFLDDGTLDAAVAGEARRVFPGCRIVPAAEAEKHLDVHLPASRFPALRGQRRRYLHLRKLTDFHAGRSGWRAMLDSDMLFFRHPSAFLGSLGSPAARVHMIDVKNAYGYPLEALDALVGGRVPERVNVGILGLESGSLDWPRIESWCAALVSSRGSSYFLEQALSAMILAGAPSVALPAADYRVMPDADECRTPTAVLHHYVDLSKRGYFRHGWMNAWRRIPR
jgi:hypothetical protein